MEPQAPKQPPIDIPEEQLTIPGRERNAVDSSPAMAIIIGLLVVAAALIFAGLYLWGSMLNTNVEVVPDITRPTAAENNEPESTTAEAEVETMAAMSTSDQLSAIAADLENTRLETLDAELLDIDAELDASLTDTE